MVNFTRTSNLSVQDLITNVKSDSSSACGCRDDCIPACQAMNELGIHFLTCDNTKEHHTIERFFTKVLTDKKYSGDLKFIALCVIRHPKSVIDKSTKKVVDAFECNPDNAEVMSKVNDHLTH